MNDETMDRLARGDIVQVIDDTIGWSDFVCRVVCVYEEDGIAEIRRLEFSNGQSKYCPLQSLSLYRLDESFPIYPQTAFAKFIVHTQRVAGNPHLNFPPDVTNVIFDFVFGRPNTPETIPDSEVLLDVIKVRNVLGYLLDENSFSSSLVARLSGQTVEQLYDRMKQGDGSILRRYPEDRIGFSQGTASFASALDFQSNADFLAQWKLMMSYLFEKKGLSRANKMIEVLSDGHAHTVVELMTAMGLRHPRSIHNLKRPLLPFNILTQKGKSFKLSDNALPFGRGTP